MTNRATTKTELSLGLPVLDSATKKKILSEHFSKLGKKGGKALSKTRKGTDFYKKAQAKGVKSRLFGKQMREQEM